jgi:hypothetical protein
VDLNNDQQATGPDLLAFGPVFGAISPNAPYNVRFDISQDGKITGVDMLKFSPYFGHPCTQ